MAETIGRDGVPDGWVMREAKGFSTHVGPFWMPPEGDRAACGFVADARHGNKRGVVHGGMLATAFDVALGNAVWAAVEQRPCATVQLNVQFLAAVKLGEFALARAEVLKLTRSLVFIRGLLTVDDRLVATADGVWKILGRPG